MSAGRSIFGAAFGATVAVLAIRVNAHAQRRSTTPFQVLGDLPEVLAEDARMLGTAAREAIHDGKRAADRARIEFDVQVVAHARRNKSTDD